MKTFKALTLAVAALAPAVTLTAAQDTSGCNVPQVSFYTLDQDFSLSVAAGPTFSSQRAWYLHLNPFIPTNKKESVPVISLREILPPPFRLTDGKLTTGGFAAKGGFTVQPFPPVLEPWFFGGKHAGSAPLKFIADYECDDQGKAYLRLRTDDPSNGMCPWMHCKHEARRSKS